MKHDISIIFDELKNICEDGIEFQILKKPIEKVDLLSVAEDTLTAKSTIRNSTLGLKLYIAGKTKKSERIINNLNDTFQDEWAGEYSLEVFDVLESPDVAVRDQIIVTPTLCRISPEPEKRIIGDLSVKRIVLQALGI